MLKNWKWGCGCMCFRKRVPEEGDLPLSHAQTGKRVKVSKIQGGRKLCARMAAMGIYPGVELELLCAGCGSPCLVRVHGGTLSLGAGVSQKILVASAA